MVFRNQTPSIFRISEPRLTTWSCIMFRSLELPSYFRPSLESFFPVWSRRAPSIPATSCRAHSAQAAWITLSHLGAAELTPSSFGVLELPLSQSGPKTSLHLTLVPPSSHCLILELPSFHRLSRRKLASCLHRSLELTRSLSSHPEVIGLPMSQPGAIQFIPS